MARWTWALLSIVLLLMLGSCPVPVNSLAGASRDPSGAGPDPGSTAPASLPDSTQDQAIGYENGDGTGAPSSTAGPAAAGTGSETMVGPVPGGVGDGTGEAAPNPAVPSSPGDVQPQQAPAAASGVGPQQQEPETAKVGPAAPQQQAPQYGALDAENFMGDAPRDTVWGQPKPTLDEDSLSFAGRWKVAVIHRQGEARMLENNAEWVLELGRDGTFFARQDRGGQTWRQSGTWNVSGVHLLLHSGPGGERSYEISQEMENICVLREPGRETALFCVRDRQEAKPPAVQATYDTDFGVLNLRPAGPGHWRGSYGEPSGVLLLAQLGSYLVGTWEQAPSRGFVMLELREGGFAGAWLYAGSVFFDGRWVGVATH